jgi:hypothetical protein
MKEGMMGGIDSMHVEMTDLYTILFVKPFGRPRCKWEYNMKNGPYVNRI